jgi:hypothetical protein
MRTTEQVLRDHLERRRCGDLEGDLRANYSDELVVLSKDGIYRGKDGIRKCAAILKKILPDATFDFDVVRAADEYGMLGWRGAGGNGSEACHGADSYVIRDGRIIAQTIQYEVWPEGSEG